jgi:hypothetical protein
MKTPLPKRIILLVGALVERRTRRGSWAYLLWLLAYVPMMIFCADFAFWNLRPFQLLPLLIPIVIILVQLIWPTLLGWAVIALPSVFVAGVGVVSVILTASARVQQDELGALVISSVAAGVYVLVCVALWFARPKLADAAAVQPNPAFYEQD